MRSTTLIVHISGCYSSGLVSFIHQVVNVLQKYNRKFNFSFNLFCSWPGKILENLSFRHGKRVICFVLLSQCCSIKIVFFFLKHVWFGVGGCYSVIFTGVFNTHLTQFNHSHMAQVKSYSSFPFNSLTKEELCLLIYTSARVDIF